MRDVAHVSNTEAVIFMGWNAGAGTKLDRLRTIATALIGALDWRRHMKVIVDEAGEIIAKDPLFTANLDPASAHTMAIIGATLGALFVVGVGLLRRRRLRRSAPDQI